MSNLVEEKMKKARLFLSLATVGIGSIASAGIITWSSHDVAVDASNNQNWSNGLNWAGGVAPVAGDDIVIGIPVTNGNRVTINDLAAGTQINSLQLKANLNEANGNSINLAGPVSYTAGGTSAGKIGLIMALQLNTTISVSANTSNGRLEISGDISGPFGITKADAGRLRLVGTAKTYTGNTIVTGGLLDMSADNMLPYGAGKGDLYIGTGAQLFLNNYSAGINGLNDYSGAAGTISKTGSGTRVLTLGNGDANGAFSGAITMTGGSSHIDKVGAGIQTFTGIVALAGTSNVTGGKMIVNNSWTGGIAIGANGTLGGTGPIVGALTGAGIVSPGSSIGSLVASSAAMTGTLLAEIDGSGAGSCDILNITAALDITNMKVDFNELVVADDAAYVIAKYGSLAGLQFASVTDLPTGYSINYAYNDGVSSNNIAIVVPEPGTLSLLAGAALLGLRRRK
jgi:autotransporter-associated beta strand protein